MIESERVYFEPKDAILAVLAGRFQDAPLGLHWALPCGESRVC